MLSSFYNNIYLVDYVSFFHHFFYLHTLCVHVSIHSEWMENKSFYFCFSTLLLSKKKYSRYTFFSSFLIRCEKISVCVYGHNTHSNIELLVVSIPTKQVLLFKTKENNNNNTFTILFAIVLIWCSSGIFFFIVVIVV